MRDQKVKTLLLSAGILISILQKTNAQEQWKPQPVPIQSRWAKNVKADKPLNEYPRPQLKRKEWINLNGLWDYMIADSLTTSMNSADGKILVPYALESALSGVKKSLLPDQRLWYKRTFEVKSQKPKVKNSQKERTLLHFGAVDYQCWVYVNGEKVGSHEGGYTAFSFDITDALKDGVNELIVKVYDPSDRGVGPHGKQVLNPGNIYYTPSSGIWQTVWLETVPETHIEGLKLTPDVKFGGDANASRLNVEVNTNKNCDDCKVEIVTMSGRKAVANYTANLQHTTYNVQLKNPHLWSPEDPYLYDLVVRIKKGNNTIDEVKSYFGMRKVEIKKDDKGFDRIFLNNEYTYNLGVLDQGFWPDGLYTAPTDEALKFDIEAIKTMGFNTIRKHIKVEPARWYYWADKLGMLVWQDFVNPNQMLPEGAKEAFERGAQETMKQLHNYPSVITWVLFNERWGAYDQQRLTEWVKKEDPSRLVNGHSGELLYVNDQLREPADAPYISSDLTDVHSYPEPRNAMNIPGKARVLGEFGGVGVAVPGHEWNDLQGWGYVQATPDELADKYEHMTQQLKQLKTDGLSASIYTQPFDVEGEENGLLSYDREVIKLPLEKIRTINKQIIPATKDIFGISNHFLATTMNPDDTDERYAEFLEDFQKGKRDSAFLRRLITMSIRKKDQSNTTLVTSSYLKIIRDLMNKDNLMFIGRITRTSLDSGFKLLLQHKEKVDSILGVGYARNKIAEVIEREEVDPFIVNNKNPNWDEIQQRVGSKYGNIGEEYILGQRMSYYWIVTKDWTNFSKYYKLYFERALNHLNECSFHLNNASYHIFEHESDTSILNLSMKVMRYSLDHYDNDNVNAYDTYANLLYKIGRVDDAILWEEKAIKMATDNSYYKDILIKMKSGLPTWPNR